MNPLLLDLPSRLETARLYLRPYQAGDGKWLHAIYQENEVHLAEGIAGIAANFGLDLTSEDGAEIFVRQLVADWHSRRRFVFGVWHKADERYVGEIWIEARDWKNAVHEIGYYLVQDQLGQGFATEATHAGLNFIFQHLGAEKVSLTCDEDNVSSYRVAERCGFIREGCHRSEIQRGEQRIGKLYYGMLLAEYKLLSIHKTEFHS